MSRALLLVLAFSGFTHAARADDKVAFVALVNPSGMLVRGPTGLPGIAGYSPSLLLGLQHGRIRLGGVAVLHLGAPTPSPTFSAGLRFTADALRLHLPGAVEASVFGGVQVAARLGIPTGAFFVPTGIIGVRVMGLEFAVGLGAEVPFRNGGQATWNLEALSLAMNVPEFIEAICAINSGARFHGVAPP